jgi:hypothetical protein
MMISHRPMLAGKLLHNVRQAIVAGAIACIGVASVSVPLRAQSNIPLRTLRNTVATDSMVLMGVTGVRHLPNGSVLVNDPTKRQLILFDSTLRKFNVIADTSTNSPNSYGLRPSTGGLIPYVADSSLFVDVESLVFLVINPKGEFTRVMAPTRASDLRHVTAAPWGNSGFDAKGRLIYKGLRPPPGGNMGFAIPTDGKAVVMPVADSAPIMRMDLDRRSVDTVTMIKIAAVKSVLTGNQNSFRVNSVLNPLPASDEWALTPDGTIAIVRTQDYHIDWIGADGKLESSPKMPFDWKRITAEEKQLLVDSVKKAEAERVAKLPPPPPAPPGVIMSAPSQNSVVEPKELPDFYPPVRVGQVRSDLEGNIWILPSTAIPGSSGGLVYDVVNRAGTIVERVQLPKDRLIVGFGPRGTVYMHHVKSPTVTTIERAEITR